MSHRSLARRRATFGALTAAVLALALPAAAQESAYLDAVAEHFEIAADEVAILAGWGVPAEEIPVVLSVARTAGVSPDAVMALRRGGRSWGDLADRYGVHAARLHVPLPDDADAGVLSRLYEAYRSRPSTAWVSIEIRDDEMVDLVNLRFLSEYLGRSPAQVLGVLTQAGSGPAAFERLRRG
jgi:hypothetical protein